MAEDSKTPSDVAFDRAQEDDHDLLTFGEAGLRLNESVGQLRARLMDLRASSAPGAQVSAVEHRLAAMEDAAERNRAQPINDENFARFFGYEGKARRNTSW